jgi:poly-gamma-glutamate synthesis protein (capsule biosynthesis protein)
MKISFIGDICLARMIQAKYQEEPYEIVDSQIKQSLQHSDFVIANLESPITNKAQTDGDHLSFRGTSEMLNEFKFVDCFSLSNNHINDCGCLGMTETTEILDSHHIAHTGIFRKEYSPYIVHHKEEKIVIITCTDMMNIPIDDSCEWKTLHIDSESLNQIIRNYKSSGYCVVLYAHVGMLFTRYVNPPIRKLLHEKIDCGADIIVTAHAHCLGGMEYYKNKPIFHSLGDFVMDGGSFRRRQAAILNINICKGKFNSYHILPTIITKELTTRFATQKLTKQLVKNWNDISNNLQNNNSVYSAYFKKKYKKEMILHTLSTLHFLFVTKGLVGMFKLIFKRFEEVKRMKEWLIKDRSEDRRDDEAILKDRKRFSQNDLFGRN